MKWIFPRPIYDIIFVLFPGIIYLAYVLLFPNIEFDFLHIFLFINIAQSGHIFATLPRTYLRPLEFKRNSIYWWAPLGISVFLLICSFFKFFLFALLIFQIAQQVHILRQYFGFGKIYQRKNQRFCRTSDRFLYLLILFPIALFYVFSPKSSVSLYFFSESFRTSYLGPFQFLYVLTIISWLIFEVWLYRRRIWEPNRFFSVCGPALLYGSLILFLDFPNVLWAFGIQHGISYMALAFFSEGRLHPVRKQSLTFLTFFGIIVSFTMFSLYLRKFFKEGSFDLVEIFRFPNFFPVQAESWSFFIFSLLIILPQFMHYISDSVIWKGNHPDAQIIFSEQKTAATAL